MKKTLRKNFIVSLIALGTAVALLCGTVYAWFALSTKPSGEIGLVVGGKQLEGELFLGRDFNRDGILDHLTDGSGAENAYTAIEPVTGLLPTQVVTVKVALRSPDGARDADVSVRLIGSFPTATEDTVGWFDLTELTAECGGAPYAFDRDASVELYWSKVPLTVLETGTDLILRFRIKTPDASARFDWNNVYAQPFRAVITVTPRQE